jgi:xylulokinase
MFRAVMEGVSFGMRDQLELLRGLGVKPSDAVVSGGAANSAIWRQLTTDMMGIPLYTVNTSEGGALGAAILAAVGAGSYPDVPSACKQMVHKVDVVQPDPAGVAEYERLYPTFQGLYPALKNTFSALAAFEA